jgi:hypothetical protein
MHTFKVSVPHEYDVAFIHNPDLSGDMAIVVTDKQKSGLRVRMAGSVLREFMEHVQEYENDEDEPCADPTTELEMLRQENEDLWNALRIMTTANSIPTAAHNCEEFGWPAKCIGCEMDEKRRALRAKIVMGDKMSGDRYLWMLRDPLKEDADEQAAT